MAKWIVVPRVRTIQILGCVLQHHREVHICVLKCRMCRLWWPPEFSSSNIYKMHLWKIAYSDSQMINPTDRWVCTFLSGACTRFTCIVLSEVSQQWLNRLPWTVVLHVMVPRGSIKLTYVKLYQQMPDDVLTVRFEHKLTSLSDVMNCNNFIYNQMSVKLIAFLPKSVNKPSDVFFLTMAPKMTMLVHQSIHHVGPGLKYL